MFFMMLSTRYAKNPKIAHTETHKGNKILNMKLKGRSAEFKSRRI